MTTTSGGRPRATTRISLGRVAVVILATIAVLGSSAWLVRSTWVRSIVPGLTTFAGYVDVTATPPYPFETPRGPAQQDVILAFEKIHHHFLELFIAHLAVSDGDPNGRQHTTDVSC